MRKRTSRSFKFMSCLAAVGVGASGLAGCSLVPDVFPLHGHAEKKALFNAVVRGVQCEIRQAVREQVEDQRYGRSVEWLKKWSALINMTLTFDETFEFNPGVSLKTPNLLDANVWLANNTKRVVSQSYAFGLGGHFEGERSRTENIEYFYPFEDFLPYPEDRTIPCYHLGALQIMGDLKLKDWLDDVLEPYKKCAFTGRPVPGQSALFIEDEGDSADKGNVCTQEELSKHGYGKDNPIKAFSHTVTFKLTLEAGVTPVWKLVRIESSGNSPLFRANRKDTSELLITFGSAYTDKIIAKKEKGQTARPIRSPSRYMLDRNLSLQIGSAVRDALAQ